VGDLVVGAGGVQPGESHKPLEKTVNVGSTPEVYSHPLARSSVSLCRMEVSQKFIYE